MDMKFTASDSRQLRSLEEEWMENGVDNRSIEEGNNRLEYVSEDRSVLGSHEDLFKGMVMGFLFGIIMLLWVMFCNVLKLIFF